MKKSIPTMISVPQKLRERIENFKNQYEFPPTASVLFNRAMTDFLDSKDAEKKPTDSK